MSTHGTKQAACDLHRINVDEPRDENPILPT